MVNQYQKADENNRLVFVGTYTDGGSEGIYTCQLDMASGALRKISVAGNVENPSYLAIDSVRQRLYAVNELLRFRGQPGGSVSAFAIQPSSGELSFINRQPSHGGAPCYLTLDKSGLYLFAANYAGGTAVTFPIGADGALGEATGIATHSGSSVHPNRQEGPHPHSIVLDPANDYAFVPDLGLDKVMQYTFDPVIGLLRAIQPPWVATEPGCGPRHMVFHPHRNSAYVINELNSTITAYNYDPSRGLLEASQTLSSLPEGFSGENIAAGLHITPNGKFLFGSNRGHDSIASYAVDPETGWLTHAGWTPSQGQKPRAFAIDSTGTILLVANQDSYNIVTFWIDVEDGRLIPTGHELSIPTPVCPIIE